MMTGIGMGLGGIGLVFMLLFWGVLIFGGVWLAKMLFTGNQQNKDRKDVIARLSAREVLDHRYARGEIDREEYEQIKTDLK